MKRLTISALLCGALGGFLTNPRYAMHALFSYQPPQPDFYMSLFMVLVESTLFALPICLTKAIVEMSCRLAKVSTIVGVITGILTAGLIVLVISLRFPIAYILISGTLLGLAATVINAFNETQHKRIYLYALIGLVAGGIAIGMHYLAIGVAMLLAFLFAGFSISQSTVPYYYYILVGPIDGAAQSVAIWLFLALAKQNFFSFMRRNSSLPLS